MTHLCAWPGAVHILQGNQAGFHRISKFLTCAAAAAVPRESSSGGDSRDQEPSYARATALHTVDTIH
jgi:hypothetical protein